MLCSVDDCQKQVHSKGLCQMHYRRQVNHGSTDEPVRVNKPGPKKDPSKPHSKFRGPVPRKKTTHCSRGHERTEENTYVASNGARHCKECAALRMRGYRPKPVESTLPDGRVLKNGRGLPSARKTHCPKGHEYIPENTRLAGNRRLCRACAAANSTNQRFIGYGITKDIYTILMEAQHGSCAICFNTFTSTAHIDHDHSCCPGRKACGKCVRGLLCRECNTGLGKFKDSMVLLESAVSYVGRKVSYDLS